MDQFFIIIIFSVVLFVFSSRIQSKAQKELTDQEKVKLINEFSGGRVFKIIPVLIILLFYYLNFKFRVIEYNLMNYLYFGGLTVLFIFYIYKNDQKLANLNFDKKFINKFRIASLLRIIAIGIFFFAILNFNK